MEEGEGSRGEEEGRRGRGDKVCEVCSAPSLGHNFGAVSCESCKAFFRRNAFRLQVLMEKGMSCMSRSFPARSRGTAM